MSAALLAAERRDMLDAFARAIDRETHNLSRWPELVWQQLYNRLQWEVGPIQGALQAELSRQLSSAFQPWLRLKAPLPETEALVRTLDGHTDWVRACGISTDASFIVSASDDGTLKVWDVMGRERATLVRNASAFPTTVAISPDGAFIVSSQVPGRGVTRRQVRRLLRPR